MPFGEGGVEILKVKNVYAMSIICEKTFNKE